jgi:hypothetical protein
MNPKNESALSRRNFLQLSGVAATAATLRLATGAQAAAAGGTSGVPATGPKPLEDIGSRRELFVDDFLIDQMSGRAELRLHHPQPREIVIEHDAPWEGSGSGYHSLFKDGDLYRLYYKAWHLEGSQKNPYTGDADAHRLCYAESTDGVHWRKPELGLFEFNGSKKNNIVIPSGPWGSMHLSAAESAVFMDENPNVPADARYKALVRSRKPFGLIAFKSGDGVRWTPMSEKPIITEGAFDSQNLAFWDDVRGEYRAYWRFFSEGVTNESTWKINGYRGIRTATSKDFMTWAPFQEISYFGAPTEIHLYTNQIKPYHRAPHLYVGFPMHYVDRGWSDSTRALPELENRELRASVNPRYGTAVSDSLLMTSRDGVRFKRWDEAFLRPGIEREGTWNYGHQCLAWHLIETPSDLIGGAPNELSFYAVESYWTGNSSLLRRHTLRLDGFASLHAAVPGGEVVTRPLRFKGTVLRLNFSSAAAGGIRVELQDEGGRALPGFALADSQPVFGDALDRKVTWKGGSDLSALQGKPVRVRFVLEDADIFALRFATA